MVKSALIGTKTSKKTTKKAVAPKSKVTTGAAKKTTKKVAVEQTKRKKGSKPKRDPNKPKRAGQPYLFFCNEERSKIKAEKPNLTAPEVLKECGARWQEAKKGDISKWTKMAEKDKVRYTDAMAKYKSSIAGQKEEAAEASEAEESAD